MSNLQGKNCSTQNARQYGLCVIRFVVKLLAHVVSDTAILSSARAHLCVCLSTWYYECHNNNNTYYINILETVNNCSVGTKNIIHDCAHETSDDSTCNPGGFGNNNYCLKIILLKK